MDPLIGECDCFVPTIDFCELCPVLDNLLDGGVVTAGAAMLARDAKVTSCSTDLLEVTLKDVVGQTEAKKKVSDFVRAIKQPGSVHKLPTPSGSSKHRSLLLCGRQGSGKTLLLDATMGEVFKVDCYDQVSTFLTGADHLREEPAEDVEGFLDCVRAAAASNTLGPTVLFIDDIDILLEDIRQATPQGEIDNRVCNKLKELLFSPVIVVATARQPWLLPPEFLNLTTAVRLSQPSSDDRKKIVKQHLMGFPLDLTKAEWERMSRDLAPLSQRDVARMAEDVADEARKKLREATFFRRVSEDGVTGGSHYSPCVDGEVLEVCLAYEKGAFRSSLAEIIKCQFALRLPTIGFKDFKDHFLAALVVSSPTEEDKKLAEFARASTANEGRKVNHALHKSVLAYVASAVRNLSKFSGQKKNKI